MLLQIFEKIEPFSITEINFWLLKKIHDLKDFKRSTDLKIYENILKNFFNGIQISFGD